MKAILLDRDGTINYDPHAYIAKAEDFEFLPRVIDALKLVPKEEYKMIIVTNQGGIGTKEYTEEDLAEIHKKMLDELSQNNVTIDGIYYCPHAPVAKCNCRKPKPTMIEKAKNDFKINLSESYFIGDKTGDIKAGENAGCKTILVKTGYAGKDNHYKIHPNHVAKDLYEAINIILTK